MKHIQSVHPVILDSIKECERIIKNHTVDLNKLIDRCKYYEEQIIGNQIKLNLLKGLPVKKEEVEA